MHTAVLVAVTPTFVKLITHIGKAPACPIGSSCCCDVGCCNEHGNGYGNAYGYGYGAGYGYGYGAGYGYGNSGCCCNGYGNSGYGKGECCNWLGSISEIPVCNIACFTHNAI